MLLLLIYHMSRLIFLKFHYVCLGHALIRSCHKKKYLFTKRAWKTFLSVMAFISRIFEVNCHSSRKKLCYSSSDLNLYLKIFFYIYVHLLKKKKNM